MPDWFIAWFTSDPSSRANSTRRTITRVACLLGLLALVAALPSKLGDSGLAHYMLASTALVPLAAITLAIHRMGDERVESVTRRLLRGRHEGGHQGTLRDHAAELFLHGGPVPVEDENHLYRRVWIMLVATGLPAIATWSVLSWIVVGAGFAELTMGDALVLSPLWLAFVPAAGVLAVLFEALGQATGCPRVGGFCVKHFGHDGVCEIACGHGREGMGLFPKLGGHCTLIKDHDGNHLHLCGKYLGRIRIFRPRFPCALPDGHDDACRSMCSTPRCRRVDGHEGEHSLIRLRPTHGWEP